MYPLLFDVFQPRYFHIGHDELLGALGTASTWKGRPSYERFSKDVKKLHDYLKNRGIHTMMWGDMLLPNNGSPTSDSAHDGGGANIANAIDAIPKYILICDWHYGDATEYPTLKYFRDHGFGVVATPWFRRLNSSASRMPRNEQARSA